MKKLLIATACAMCAGLVPAQDAPVAAKDAAKQDAQAARRLARQERMQGRFKRARFIEAKPFGKFADGTETKIYRLQSPDGLIIDVSDYGGRLVRCYAPDKFGNLADVTLGWNTPGEYEKNGFSMGTLIGRYGNRIAEG